MFTSATGKLKHVVLSVKDKADVIDAFERKSTLTAIPALRRSLAVPNARANKANIPTFKREIVDMAWVERQR